MSKPEQLSINIISPEGKIKSINVTSDMTINKIKNTGLKHFYSDNASRNSANYRLIHTSKFTELTDSNSVSDEKISQNDELLLIKSRRAPSIKELSQENFKGPNEELILQATKDLPIRNPPKRISSLYCPAEFQNDLRKILITLAKASARIMTYSPDADRYCEVLKQKLEARCKPHIDPNAVKTLTEMGYSDRSVIKALRLKKLNMMEALDWLTDHQYGSDDEDEDFMTSEKECEDLKDENVLSVVERLLDSYKRFRKMDFKPNVPAFEILSEMGFEEKSIIKALKITGNNRTNACEWLLGERNECLHDIDKELDPDNPIYKAIMNDPRIQLSLTNPNMLLLYLSMLESPVLTDSRIRDPEGPILDHIIVTCYAEKHALHMKQYLIDA
ncbi:ubiquitin-associated domain-containing protein 1 [Ceratina calcarata]|uniref:Ubiquitin-associated domain-containing protein 1 n=1 Tax=Ceratina calcarata TaxID=156304 RepID=A0AAJ7WAX5_9HYME|nr:ubiquitin-associated domain-containing protein 1 [Ceratina calcarata]